MSTLVKGTLILTVATMVSKILGFLYVVPFTALVGTQGYILFEYAYKPYVIILSFATLGVPLAVSKFVSKYNELGDYQSGHKLFKSGLLFLTITGSVCFVILYSFAPSIASVLVNESDKTGNSIVDIIFVIRMVSFALIVVPPMAIARGFFQGHQMMSPTAVSQVVEQLIRIVFILIGAFLVIHTFQGNIATAVGIATLAAFVGAIGGSVVLIRYWFKLKPILKEKMKSEPSKSDVSLANMYKELISYAVPFVIVGLAIPLYQTIDTFTINQAMMSRGVNQLEAETVNSIVALVQKIIMIPVSLATALGLTLVPTITKSFIGKDMEQLKLHISKTFLIVFFLTLPSVILLMALAEPAYSFLFGSSHSSLGGELMLWYAPTAIILSVFIVTSAILQGMNRQKFVIVSLMVGLSFKGITNFHFVSKLEGLGSVLTTDIGFLISITLNILAIKKFSQFNFSEVNKTIFAIIPISVLMGSLTYIVDFIVSDLTTKYIANNFIGMSVRLIIAGGFGSIIYCAITYKLKLMEEVLGGESTKKIQNLTKSLTRLPRKLFIKKAK